MKDSIENSISISFQPAWVYGVNMDQEDVIDILSGIVAYSDNDDEEYAFDVTMGNSTLKEIDSAIKLMTTEDVDIFCINMYNPSFSVCTSNEEYEDAVKSSWLEVYSNGDVVACIEYSYADESGLFSINLPIDEFRKAL